MLNSILGERLSWHFADGLVFEPAIVGTRHRRLQLERGGHTPDGHAIQHFPLPAGGGSRSRDHGGLWYERGGRRRPYDPG